MKNFLQKLSRVLFLVSYVVFFVLSATFITAFLVELKRYNDLSNTYTSDKDMQLKNASNDNNKVDNLKSNNNELNNQITALKDQNSSMQTKIDNFQKNGYGEIDGKISGQVILNDNNVSQYQNVCAENINNTNLQYCQNVSTINQNFILLVPAGTYRVYARILNKDKIVIPTYHASYTEYVKCIDEKAIDQCDIKLSKNIINISVKPGEKNININPVDLNNI